MHEISTLLATHMSINQKHLWLVANIKTHDSESRAQEEPATTEWVIYKEHRQKTRKCSSQAAQTASAQLSQS